MDRVWSEWEKLFCSSDDSGLRFWERKARGLVANYPVQQADMVAGLWFLSQSLSGPQRLTAECCTLPLVKTYERLLIMGIFIYSPRCVHQGVPRDVHQRVDHIMQPTSCMCNLGV